MSGFFDLRLDFVYFLHGIALALLASSALGLSHLENRRTWWWLALFAAAQAAFIWLKAVTHDVGEGPIWLGARATLLLASFACLVQFARSKLLNMGLMNLRRWVHIIPIGLAATIVAIGGLKYLVWIFPAYGLISGLLGGFVFLARSRGSQRKGEAQRLKQCSLSISAYVITFGFIGEESLLWSSTPAEASMNPPSWWFVTKFSSAILAAIACWCVGQHNSTLHHAKLAEQGARSWSRKRTGQLIGFLLVIAFGWLASERAVNQKGASMRSDILLRTSLVAASIPPDHIATLVWGEADLINPRYQEIKARLMALMAANSDMRFVMLTGLRDGKAYFIADSEKPESPDYSPPGEYYDEASPEYLQALSRHQPFVLGPIVDHWGVWVSSSVPIGEFGPDKRWVVAEIDTKATNWNGLLRSARLPVLLIALLISLLLITFSYTHERIHESLAKLTASELRNSSLVEGSPYCVQMFGMDGRCLAINQNGLNTLARKREEIIGQRFIDMWPAYEQKIIQVSMGRTLKGHSTLFEANYLRSDGETIIWRVALTPVFDSRHEVQNFVAISVDVSDFRFSEKALVAAKEAAEAATRAKSEFLAVMSHEIRTPLGGVIGMLNVLRKHPMSPEQQLYTELAHENAENLLGLLDDVLDAAKVEAGKLTIEVIPFDPILELNRTLEPMRIRAEGKGLTFKWTIAPGLPPVLRGDPTRIRQVLANLLSNALKFTERGGIQTNVSSEKNAEGKVVLRIAVKDTGIGIPADRLARLFARFEQADVSTSRRFGGTGLGLSIVKSLAELMQGNVKVESFPGAGTTFTFTATLGEGSPQDLAPVGSRFSQDATSLKKHRACLHVLCAEDDSTNQVAAEFLVKQMGHTIEFVENGKLAVEWLSRQRATVVLMDNRMPVMDGFQATHIIRDPASAVIDHNIYIIANTANASSGYRERCLAAGMNDYLTKPLREAELHLALDRAIEFYEKSGSILPPMPDDPQLHLVHTGATPTKRKTTSAPKGMSADELLAMLDEAETKPSDPTSNLPPEAIERITVQYFKEAPLRLAEIRASISQPDFNALGRAAHSLKSSSRYIQAHSLSELGAEMERLADASQLDDIPSLLELAEKEFSDLLNQQQPTKVDS